MKTIFEKSVSGRSAYTVPEQTTPQYVLPKEYLTDHTSQLPSVSEVEIVRHYTELSKRAFGVDDGFYPLGSCTMKYNPKLNEFAASLDGFTALHPLQDEQDVQGALELLYKLEKALTGITGMDAFTLQPAAGAHGEYTGLSLIKAYHTARGDTARTKIIVPDSAHGTNPASAAMLGFTIVNVPSAEDGCVDVAALKAVCDETTAGLMLTNPNTLGLFEKHIAEIADTVHGAGGLLYYDGANLNAIMGITRPGDMGFDVMHINLHKTFATPHGGGGPGSGPVGCKEALADYLPSPVVRKQNGAYTMVTPPCSIGRVKSFFGNFLVCVKAYTYILTLGGEGLKNASEMAVLNANYLKKLLKSIDNMPETTCKHEFVASLEQLKHDTGVSALDVAKAMIDCGMHPPTMYFPLIVHEALMFEPTETESKETLDEAAQKVLGILERAKTEPQALHDAPHRAPISRPDEVLAARKPKLKA